MKFNAVMKFARFKSSFYILFTSVVFSALAHGEALKTLRWGADIESGAPFAYKNPQNPNEIIGFEAEIVSALASEMGRKVDFVQNNWDGLIEGLKRKDYDIVVNGLEITPDRAEVVRFSQPYYITAEVITVKRSTYTVHTLKDLENRKVGTLGGALAERILLEQAFPMEIIRYSEEVNLYNDLAYGRLSAVFLDEPIALYYGAPHPELKNVGSPIGRMEYGIASRLDDKALAIEIDQALQSLKKNGKLNEILARWGLWNELTAAEWKQPVEPSTKPVMYEQYLKTAWPSTSIDKKLKRYLTFLPVLGKGALMTVSISLVSMALAVLGGLMLAAGRLYGPRPVAYLSLAAIELVRGTPLLIQLYLIFYGLPRLGINLDPFVAAVIGLGLNYAAYEAEVYRAGIQSVNKHQIDAARALGLSSRQVFRHVTLPQASRLVIPPMTNDFIALLKDSSLVSIITMVELTTTYSQLASTYFDYLGIGILVALIYFLLGLPFVGLAKYFEKRLNVSKP